MANASYDFVATGNGRVMVTSGGLDRFSRQDKWLSSGLRFYSPISVEFEFDSHGLCGTNWFDCSGGGALDIEEPYSVDSEALAALAQDAQEWLSTGSLTR